MKRYCFDIDGTICTNTWGEYGDAEPFYDRIKKVNKLYDEENYIIYFTARGMGRFGGNVDKVVESFYAITESQLDRWGCKYHKLILGKPSGDYYIDDKGISANEFFIDVH